MTCVGANIGETGRNWNARRTEHNKATTTMPNITKDWTLHWLELCTIFNMLFKPWTKIWLTKLETNPLNCCRTLPAAYERLIQDTKLKTNPLNCCRTLPAADERLILDTKLETNPLNRCRTLPAAYESLIQDTKLETNPLNRCRTLPAAYERPTQDTKLETNPLNCCRTLPAAYERPWQDTKPADCTKTKPCAYDIKKNWMADVTLTVKMTSTHGFDQQGWYGMFVACGIWCLADVSSVSPSSEQTGELAPALLRRRANARNVS